MIIVMANPDLSNLSEDFWTWDINDKSFEVYLEGDMLKTAHLYPRRSKTAAVRGTHILNKDCRHYWEIKVTDSTLFTKNIMFGIGTKKWLVHANTLDNTFHILGNDDQSFGLSFNGLIWHKNISKQYSKSFEMKSEFTVGILFDGSNNLSYILDGEYLGVAFTDLHLVEDDLYPIVCASGSYAKVCLVQTKRDFLNLQDQCRPAVLSNQSDIMHLNLPNVLNKNLKENSITDEEDQRNSGLWRINSFGFNPNRFYPTGFNSIPSKDDSESGICLRYDPEIRPSYTGEDLFPNMNKMFSHLKK